MADRLINSKCKSYHAMDAEIAALPSEIKRMVDREKSAEVGYPVFSLKMQACGLFLDMVLDAALLASCATNSDAIQKFILAEMLAFSEGFVMELVNREHCPPELVDG